MARKSRKVNNKVDMPSLKPSLIQTAAYVRLSLEDRAQKGSSIENQQHMISYYIDEHPDFELYDTYIDSGISGTTFERPSFQRMLADSESGKINCIIVKDLSRLGRSMIDTGYYIERVFPFLGVRLISISDNYDSDNYDDNARMPLINLVNEVYALDISRKTRSQARQAMKDGVYVGGYPPYGYMRSPDDRHKLIVDNTAAEIVKQIFICAADNVSIYDIAKRLNLLKILSPNAYRASLKPSPKTPSTNLGVWYAKTVERILKNEMYLGRLVQGKSKTFNFHRQKTPTDEWMSAYDTHEAIIPVELFQAAQLNESNKSQGDLPKRSKVSSSSNIFRGKIYCAHCSRAMERTKSSDKYTYRCVTKLVAPDLCDGNRISEDMVRGALLEQLIQYRENLAADINLLPGSADDIPELQFVEMELSNIQDITRSLYENLVNGVLDEKEYRELKDSYQEKMDTIRQRADHLKQKLRDEQYRKVALQESLRIIRRLTEASMLTKEHVDRFIERIEVFRDGRIYVRFYVSQE